MSQKYPRPRLVLIKGDSTMIEGPISRLGLHNRIEPISSKVIAFMIFAKIALLAGILYYFWG